MDRKLTFAAALTILVLLLGPLAFPAQACRAYDGFDPQKPFAKFYLEHYPERYKTIFRGRPVDFRLIFAEPGHSIWVAEISFAVVETYRGRLDEMVTVLWLVDPLLRSRDLDAFETDIGNDLVIVLEVPNDFSLRFSPLLPIATDSCVESAMRSYAVMEPVLRERGFIN